MSGPEITLKLSEQGVAQVEQKLGTADGVAVRLEKSIQRLESRAELKEAQRGSAEYQAALERLGNTAQRTGTSTAQMASQFLMGANAALEIGSKVLDAAQAIWDFAEAGAAAADVAATFAALGDAAPGMDKLRQATAGVVDDTTLQQYAILAERMGATSDEAQNLAARVTQLAVEQGKTSEIGRLLEQSARGTGRVMKELGVDLQATMGDMEGLSEESKRLAEIQAVAAEGSLDLVDGLDSQAVAFGAAKTGVANLVSDLQISASTFLVQSGVIEKVTAIIEEMAPAVMEVAQAVLGLAGPIMQILRPALEMGIMQFKMVMAIAEPLIDIIAALANVFSQVQGAVWEMAGDLGNATVNLLGFNDGAGKSAHAFRDFRDAIDGAKNSAKELGDELANVGKEMSELEKSRADKAMAEAAAANRTAGRALKLEADLRGVTDETERRAIAASAKERARHEDAIINSKDRVILEGEIQKAMEARAKADEDRASAAADWGKAESIAMQRDAEGRSAAAMRAHEEADQQIVDLENAIERIGDEATATGRTTAAVKAKTEAVRELTIEERIHLDLIREKQQAAYTAALDEARRAEITGTMLYQAWAMAADGILLYKDAASDLAETRARQHEEEMTRQWTEAEVAESVRVFKAERDQEEAAAQEAMHQAVFGAAISGGRAIIGLFAETAREKAILGMLESAALIPYNIATLNPAGVVAAGLAFTKYSIMAAKAGGGGGQKPATPPPAAAPSSGRSSGGSTRQDRSTTIELWGVPVGRGVARGLEQDSRRGGWRIGSDTISDSNAWRSP